MGNSAQIRPVDLRIPAIEKYAYCLCLHVKPTTIFIAVFKLVRALIFVSILLDTEFSMNEQMNDLHFASAEERSKSTVAAINILTRIITASVSALGIYAVISGRAALLMPLYAMLLIDFFFALPAFYDRDYMESRYGDGLSDLGRGSRTNSPGPGAGLYPNNIASEQYQRYSFVVFSTLVMIVKIYFLCVIWKCYRYLRLIELLTPIRLSEIITHVPHRGQNASSSPSVHPYPLARVLAGNARYIETDQMVSNSSHSLAPPPYDSIASSMKPPNYEEAIKSSGLFLSPNFQTDIQGQQQLQLHSDQPNVMDGRQSQDTDNQMPPPQYAPPYHLTNHHREGDINSETSSANNREANGIWIIRTDETSATATTNLEHPATQCQTSAVALESQKPEQMEAGMNQTVTSGSRTVNSHERKSDVDQGPNDGQR